MAAPKVEEHLAEVSDLIQVREHLQFLGYDIQNPHQFISANHLSKARIGVYADEMNDLVHEVFFLGEYDRVRFWRFFEAWEQDYQRFRQSQEAETFRSVRPHEIANG